MKMIQYLVTPIFRKIYEHFPQLQSRIYPENAGGTLHPICIF